jgi:putative transposase
MLVGPSQKTHATRKRKTCHRENTPGDAHALTFSCFKNRPFLNRDRSRRWLLDALAKARDKHGFELWAYVLMPEHVHLLIYPLCDEYSISGILLDMKRPVARQAVRFVRAQAPSFLKMMRDEQPNGEVAYRFWQRGGGYDRNLVNTKTVHATIDYIHANPVRRGLADTPEDWPWSSARFFAGRDDYVLAPDVDSMPPRDQWQR